MRVVQRSLPIRNDEDRLHQAFAIEEHEVGLYVSGNGHLSNQSESIYAGNVRDDPCEMTFACMTNVLRFGAFVDCLRHVE